ncbi:MAG: hypothetical protein HYV33_00600 [Candidatus Kerfeldbacteria bacterium]|nr:hypothetical protein [Candidatus Kerfeldbacteria bacterium]
MISLRNFIGSAASVMVLVVALPAAALTTTQVGTFDNSNQAHIFKHHDRLFAIAEENDGTIGVYGANRSANTWNAINDDAPTISDLVADTNSITRFRVFNGKLYLAAVNQTGVAQVWQVQRMGRPALWQQAGEAGFGDSANTAVSEFFRTDDTLYALTANAAGAGLFSTTNGEDWTQVGTYGLGQNIGTVNAATHYTVADVAYKYIGTADGMVYRSAIDDLVTWESVGDIGDAITAMHSGPEQHLNVAAVVDGVTKVFVSTDGNTFVQMGADNLGEATTEKVTRFARLPGFGGLFALTKNSTAGAAMMLWNETTETWETAVEAGLGNSANTALNHVLRYHGKVYLPTTNATNAEVYRLTKG